MSDREMAWQPIKTAPKDRSEVLLIGKYPAHLGFSDIYHGWWDASHRRWMRWPHDFEPTHWMPKPPPPEA